MYKRKINTFKCRLEENISSVIAQLAFLRVFIVVIKIISQSLEYKIMYQTIMEVSNFLVKKRLLYANHTEYTFLNKKYIEGPSEDQGVP